MDVTFWLGIVLGFALSVFLWYFTTKVLTPRLSVSALLEKSSDRTGRLRYRFRLRNEGHRDAVDVRVKCTLFSQGWAGASSDEIATVDLPVSVGQIDVMPCRRWPLLPARLRPLDIIGDRIVTLQLEGISEFQKSRLGQERRASLEKGELGLEELLRLGSDSFINVVVYGFDRFSGSRNVYSERYYRAGNIAAISER